MTRAIALALVFSVVSTIACGPSSTAPTPVGATCSDDPSVIVHTTFHGDRTRRGWVDAETTLTPTNVGSSAFGARWSSDRFDDALVDGHVFPGRMYASPLYVDDVVVHGAREGVVIAATSNGFVYALRGVSRCVDGPRVPGAILWRTQLTNPIVVPKLDGGVPLGVMSTPVIDLSASPPRIYVTSVDATRGWEAFALDLATGEVLPGWPIVLDDASLSAVNANGPAKFSGGTLQSQRGALNLSPKGDLLYVPFGAYYDQAIGWLAVIDTQQKKLVRAFSGAPSFEETGNAGVWGPGGTSIDDDGLVYATTGNSPEEMESLPNVWGESLLRFAPPLTLQASYSPWNWCALEKKDIDLGGSSPLLLPAFDATSGSVPHLIAFGGKQGNVYLLDRDHLAPRIDRRPSCSSDPSGDASLLPPEPQPHLGARGPINVFGPYSETYGNLDFAKMRSALAYFRDDAGRHLLFASGSTKQAVDSSKSVPPCLARIAIVTAPGAPPYLALDAYETTLTFENPGSPVITSHGARDAIVWVLDENAPRTAALTGPLVGNDAPTPTLYAIDAATMKPLWRSAKKELEASGKYATPTIAHGTVFVGTDRIQAFGLSGGT